MRTKLLLASATMLAAGLANPPNAQARARDGSGVWRFDARAVNGSFGRTVGTGPDRWLSVTAGGYDVTVRLADIFGTYLASGAETFSGCGSGPCIRASSVYTLKGHFSSRNQDNMCVFYRWYWTNEPDIVCYDQYGSGLYVTAPVERNTAFAYAMPATPSSPGNGYAVGDFDGDGFDEVLTYNHADGSGARVWHYDPSTWRFVENTNMPANLAGLNWPGGVRMYAGNFHDSDGFTGLDDLVVANETTREIIVYESRRPSGGYARFWGWYGPTSQAGITVDDDITVARYDESGFEALVRNTYQGSGNRGKLRAFALAWPMTEITANSDMANMQTSDTTGFTGQVHLVWGEINGYDALRDDNFQFFDDYTQYSAYDAHPGSPPPWWIWFSQNTNYLRYELGF